MPAPNDPVKAEEWRRKLSDKAKLRVGERNSFFGKKHSDDSRIKMKEAHRNRSDEWRRKQSDAQKGRKASEESCRKMSASRKGKKRPEKMQILLRTLRKGAKHTDKSRSKMSASLRISESLKVAQQSEGYIRKQRLAHSREKSHLWKGGVSFEPYCPKFNNDLKERVRKWFDYKCVECGEKQIGYKFPVHHVYYNKKACCEQNEDGEYIYNIDREQVKVIGNPNKFVTLCRSCHTKTTHNNRPYWSRYFEDIINTWYEGRSWVDE